MQEVIIGPDPHKLKEILKRNFGFYARALAQLIETDKGIFISHEVISF